VKLFQHLVRSPRASALLVVVGAALIFPVRNHAQTVPGTDVSGTETVIIPEGVPLHVRVTRRTHLGKGAEVEGVLTEPVYVYDRLILPSGAVIRGRVSRLVPSDRKIRTQALLNGDVTPLHDPVVNFTSIRVGDQDVALSSEALLRSVQLVNFVPGGQKQSLVQKARKMIKERIQSVHDAFLAPGKQDRALKLLYSQMPYHPQRIWPGSQFIADLNAPAALTVPAEAAPVVAPADASTLDNIVVTARLVDPLSSDLAKKGDVVNAVVTRPVFNPQHQMVLAEGARLEGTVLQAEASRSFGRNGQLRFVFRGVQRTHEEQQQIHGTLTAAEGSSAQNITVDQEGGVKSNPDKNRFVAPLVLGVLAVAGHDRDRDGNGLGRDTVASNGFGIVARILALTVNDRNVSTGFATYALAKSIYFRFLTRGHAVAFPRDTLVQVQLGTRR
jgi:hypothetical protein